MRGVNRPILAVPSQLGLGHLGSSIKRCENSMRCAKDEAAVHNLYLRFLSIELAVAYRNHQTKGEGTDVRNPRRTKLRKPRLNRAQRLRVSKRDASLDWLTAQLFDGVDPTELHSSDPRRERVEYWVRIGQPLLPLCARSRAFLIVPGMRISQEV